MPIIPLKQHLYLFLIGLSDSLSTYWLKKILFSFHPTTKQPHPSRSTLIQTFKDAFIQVIVLLIIIPTILDYLDFDIVATIFQVVVLLLSYGYLFFYNIETMGATKEIALWSAGINQAIFCQFDVKEKFNSLYLVSNLIKNFIFLLLYYTPINLTLTIFSLFYPRLGSIILVISQAFFSSTFYYLEKWPYDRYNIAFIEKNISYMLGYGFVVSFICNWCLDGLYSIAGFFIISLWMMINCQLYSPPPLESLKEFSEVWWCMTEQEKRARLPNAFNIHREKLRQDKQYRKALKKSPKIVKPALLLTQFLNQKLGKRLQRKVFGIPQPSSSSIKQQDEIPQSQKSID